jgi:putative cell wall-binding protein
MRAWTVALVIAMGIGLAAPVQGASVVTERLADRDRIGTAIAVSQLRDSAEVALLASAETFADALAGAPLAAQEGAPILLTGPEQLDSRVEAELDRLGVQRVVLLGGPKSLTPAIEAELGDRDVERIHGSDRARTATAIARRLPAPKRAFVAGAFSFPDALAVGPVAAADLEPILLALPGDTEAVIDYLDETDVTDVVVVGGPSAVSDTDLDSLRRPGRTVSRIAGAGRYSTGVQLVDLAIAEGADPARVWLADGNQFPDSLAAAPAVTAGGGVLLLMDGRNPWTTQPSTSRLRELAPARVTIVGGHSTMSPSTESQVANIVHGPDLPRGGHAIYPRHRLVAFYGHHSTAAMGVLGEQPPDQAYARLWRQAAPYEAGGRPLLPVFELIVSVATAGPGSDGDYSAPSTYEQIEPWLQAARRDGVYLLLDLQSGRTDFLTEAKRYERLLREPDVGLALDPEWRMGPNEVPGKTVGSVHASEVNAVADWLAQIVREENLPQKLLVVHQFQLRMIEDRHLLRDHDELALTIHMDGQGSRGAKLNTYAALTREPGPWHMGFKLFYDEDPNMFAPGDVLALRPEVFFVSYQ